MSRLNTLLPLAALVLSAQAVAMEPDTSAGKAVFERVCAACHLPTGEGIPSVFPPVKKSDYFKKMTAAQFVKQLDNGLTGEVTVNAQKFNSAMPPQALSDEDTAAVLNYVSIALNGGKSTLNTEQVKRLRAGK